MSEGKVVDDFVKENIELLKEEAKAEKQQHIQQCKLFSARAVSNHEDEDIGWLVTFLCSSQEKLKKGEWITANAGKKTKNGVVYEVSAEGFTLSVKEAGLFLIGKLFEFYSSIHGNNILQEAIVNIKSKEVYKPGAANRRVRDVLLGLKRPRASTSSQDISFLNKKLDRSQKEAVRCSMITQQDLAIIHGPPGTGKSTTLVEVLLQSVRRGERVLVCAASHAAVDNLMARLREKMVGKVKLVRIGHPAKIDKKQLKFTLPSLSKSQNKREHKILSEASVVFGTLTGCASPLQDLPGGHFSLTVVDECGQAMEAAVWAVVRYLAVNV